MQTELKMIYELDLKNIAPKRAHSVHSAHSETGLPSQSATTSFAKYMAVTNWHFFQLNVLLRCLEEEFCKL